jgi:hypothetical protein
MHEKKLDVWKIYGKRIAGILGMLLLFLVIGELLNVMYVSEGGRNRYLWHQFYEHEGEIDNLFLGSSHVFCGVNAVLLDDLNGQHNFDLSSAYQTLNASYYLLREADRKNSLSHVYLEMYYPVSLYIETGAENWLNIDHMELSWNKWEYFASIAVRDPRHLPEICFPFYRYRRFLGDWDYITQTIEGKRTNTYYNVFADGNGYEESMGQGYIYSSRVLQEHEKLMTSYTVLSENPMGEVSEQYLRKIISYCKEREIPITLFTVPMYGLSPVSTEHYDYYVDEIRTIAGEYGVAYYDFNLVKEEYLPIQRNEFFMDTDHLNGAGADFFTTFLNQVMSKEDSENEEYFHASFAERLRAEEPRVYGLYLREHTSQEEPDQQMKTYWIASNREDDMEYNISLVSDTGEVNLIQDFTENREFTLPAEEHGICTIRARMKDGMEELCNMEISY